MKRKDIRLFLRGVIQLSFSVYFFLAAAVIYEDFRSQTPFAVEVYNPQGLGVSMAQTFEVTGQGGFAAASVGKILQAENQEGGKSASVYYQMTMPNYGTYANLHVSEGAYFSVNDTDKNAAVIPESLAKKLFAESSGEKELHINGMKFEVCGVYKDGGILTQLGSATIPVIYGNASAPFSEVGVGIPDTIPGSYGNASGGPDIPAEHLLIGTDAGKTAQQQIQETAAVMKIPLEGEWNDLGRLHRLGGNILQLGLFFAGLWFILHFCTFSYRNMILAYEGRGDIAQRGFRFFGAAGALLPAVFGFVFLLQLVQIPAVYLPENNIFDFAYYGRQILSGIQQIHTDCRIKDFSRICAVYLCAETGCMILAVPLFWAGCRRMRRLCPGSSERVSNTC